MTKHHKSYNSTYAVKQFSVRQMLRAALVAGVVGGLANPVFAQSDLTLPTFPQDSTEFSLPVSPEASFAGASVESKHSFQSTSQRVAMLLGLKKLTPNCPLPSPVLALPTFPSTEPCAVLHPSTSAQVNTSTHAPTIFRSTSGRTDNSRTEPYTTSITLASADESLSQIEIPTRLTIQAVSAEVETTEAEETESLDVSLSELMPANEVTIEQNDESAETLLDVEVPKVVLQLPTNSVEQHPSSTTAQYSAPAYGAPAYTAPAIAQLDSNQPEQRSPELVRRPPAIQLHIGGGVGVQSTFSDSEETVAAPANFSMNDADENDSEHINTETPPANTSPKTLKVRIEGEPAQVVTRSIASSEPTAGTQRNPSFDPASFRNIPPSNAIPTANIQHTGIQSLGGPITDRPLANGQLPGGQLTVGLSSSSSSLSTQNITPQSSVPQTDRSQDSSNKNTDSDLIVSPALANPSPIQRTVSDQGNEQTPSIGPRLEVGLHESSSITTTQPLSGLSVEHPELCQVIKSGERSLSLVGLKAGQTRVALFTTSASGERKIEIREVIIAGTENSQADMTSMATEITKSIRRLYPSSRIEVIAEDDGLAVQGYAGSEAEAKKIISLIRRTSLQPVIDRLATYK